MTCSIYRLCVASTAGCSGICGGSGTRSESCPADGSSKASSGLIGFALLCFNDTVTLMFRIILKDFIRPVLPVEKERSTKRVIKYSSTIPERPTFQSRTSVCSWVFEGLNEISTLAPWCSLVTTQQQALKQCVASWKALSVSRSS